MEGLNSYWLEILFGLVSAMIMWVIHKLSKEITHYKQLLEKKENEDFANIIDSRLTPIQAEISELRQTINNFQEQLQSQAEQNIKYYGSVLQHRCETYIRRGYITHDEFDELAELLHMYETWGGNGKIHDLYKLVMALQIKEE